jgi:hypothetical protein
MFASPLPSLMPGLPSGIACALGILAIRPKAPTTTPAAIQFFDMTALRSLISHEASAAA